MMQLFRLRSSALALKPKVHIRGNATLSPPKQPLAGLRVLDMSRVLAGVIKPSKPLTPPQLTIDSRIAPKFWVIWGTLCYGNRLFGAKADTALGPT
jgi:hypothetical protein